MHRRVFACLMLLVAAAWVLGPVPGFADDAPPGKPAKPGLIPTLDESIENKTILLGSPEQVAEGIQFYRDLLGVEHLTIFPHFLGDSYKKAD